MFLLYIVNRLSIKNALDIKWSNLNNTTFPLNVQTGTYGRPENIFRDTGTRRLKPVSIPFFRDVWQP
jgi:hypothetical protein